MDHPAAASNLRSAAATAASAHRLAEAVLFLGAMLVPASVCRADPPDPQRGRALYENHCQFCHTWRVHVRPNKLPLSRSELRDIVDHWRKQQGLSWTADDTQDVVEFLDRSHYHFAPAK